MDRGITTLKALIKKVDAGQKINESEIPIVVSTTASNVVQSVNINQVPSDDESDNTFTSVLPTMDFASSFPSGQYEQRFYFHQYCVSATL